MRVAVPGGGGLLGTEVVDAIRARGWDARPLSRREADVTRPDAVLETLRTLAPDAVVNCAAYTDVDRAEAAEAEARAVNGAGAGHVAEAARVVDARLLHLSTDYVFSGERAQEWEPDDPTEPVNAYGRSKLEGEARVREVGGDALVVRTSWLYGGGGPNFVDAILSALAEGETVEVVEDQTGRPTWTRSLALQLMDLLEDGGTGVAHAADDGTTTWYGLAARARDLAGVGGYLSAVRTFERPGPARRPRHSVLALEATRPRLRHAIPHWHDSLAAYLGARRPTEGAGA